MNIKTDKKLGQGAMGTVFKGKIDNKDCIIKMEKFDGDLTTKSPFIRQIIFNEFAKNHPDHFLSLVFSVIKDNCKWKQSVPPDMKGWSKEVAEIKEKNKLTKCCIVAYAPILKYTFYELMDSLDKKQTIKALIHILETLELMHNSGFTHNDVHAGNIMCSENKTKWYLIDYGLIDSKKFEANPNLHIHGIPDVIMLTNTFFKSWIWYFAKEFPKWETLLKRIKGHSKFMEIKKYINPEIRDSIAKDEILAIVTGNLFPDVMAECFKIDKEKYLKFIEHKRSNPWLDNKVLIYMLWNYKDIKKIITYLKSSKIF